MDVVSQARPGITILKNIFDIVIVGGGMVGATLAIALSRQTSLSIAVLEANVVSDSWSSLRYHHRVSAFALSSQRIFQSLKVWDTIRRSG